MLLISQTSVPFPERDGFVYPGQPGSDGIVDFNRRWEEFDRKLPQAGRRERSGEMAWMEGRWAVAVRDYFYEPPKPGRIETMVRGTAVIAFTSEQKWLRIETEVPRWPSVRYLGWDGVARRWVLREIFSPGLGDNASFFGAGWVSGRLVLGPARQSYHGLDSMVRVTLVKESADIFRLVNEVELPGARFVAVDDTVFTRAAK